MSLARQASSISSIDLTFPTSIIDETIQSIQDPDALRFDQMIGAIESILMDPEFINLQTDFMSQYYHLFEDKDDNNIECMSIFQNYVRIMEDALESSLLSQLPWFTMTECMNLCQQFISNEESQSGGDVFDMLASICDFNEFKSMMLSYRADREGRFPDLSGLIVMHSAQNYH